VPSASSLLIVMGNSSALINGLLREDSIPSVLP
jgi:hypothetical protein